MSNEFTVVVRDRSFTLYRDQLEFDAPNYFTALFLGDFIEAQTRTVRLSRSPELFAFIVEYMSGYTILPLKVEMLPSTMTVEVARENLLRDAEFYQLDGLASLLRPELRTLPRKSDAHTGLGLAQQKPIELEDLVKNELPIGVIVDNRGVGCISEDEWQPLLIVGRGITMVGRKYTSKNPNGFAIAFTDKQRTRILKCGRGLETSPAEQKDYYDVLLERVALDGRPLNILSTFWEKEARWTIDNHTILSDQGEEICKSFAGGDVVATESPFYHLRELSRAYKWEVGGLVLCASKVIFTIGPAWLNSNNLIFRVILAECTTRARLFDDLVASLDGV